MFRRTEKRHGIDAYDWKFVNNCNDFYDKTIRSSGPWLLHSGVASETSSMVTEMSRKPNNWMLTKAYKLNKRILQTTPISMPAINSACTCICLSAGPGTVWIAAKYRQVVLLVHLKNTIRYSKIIISSAHSRNMRQLQVRIYRIRSCCQRSFAYRSAWGPILVLLAFFLVMVRSANLLSNWLCCIDIFWTGLSSSFMLLSSVTSSWQQPSKHIFRPNKLSYSNITQERSVRMHDRHAPITAAWRQSNIILPTTKGGVTTLLDSLLRIPFSLITLDHVFMCSCSLHSCLQISSCRINSQLRLLVTSVILNPPQGGPPLTWGVHEWNESN